MDEWIKLIEAIAKLIGSFAWPLVVAVIVWYLLRRHREAIDGMITRAESVTLPGGVEFTMVADQAKEQVVEAAEEVTDAPPEQRSAAVDALVEQTTRAREMIHLMEVTRDRKRPREERQQALDELRERFPLPNLQPGSSYLYRDIEELDQASQKAALLRWLQRQE